MSTQSQSANENPNFVSESYHGRQIATFHHSQGWLVYIDRVMQPNRQFGCAEDALKWLRRKTDDCAFDSRMVAFGRRPAQRQRTAMARAA